MLGGARRLLLAAAAGESGDDGGRVALRAGPPLRLRTERAQPTAWEEARGSGRRRLAAPPQEMPTRGSQRAGARGTGDKP